MTVTKNFRPILKRNEKVGYKIRRVETLVLPNRCDNPYGKLSTFGLVRLVSHLNRQRGWRLPNSFDSYTQRASQLLKDYEEEEVEKATIKAGRVARRPFGIELVRKICSDDYYTKEDKAQEETQAIESFSLFG